MAHRLFIGNTTKKTQTFVFRRPGSDRPNDNLHITINPGGQEEVRIRDLTVETIEDIIRPHLPYGMASVEEVLSRHSGAFIGMCYSIDKPVPLEKIQLGLRHNDEILNQFGEELRQAAAVNAVRAIEENFPEFGQVDQLEMSIEEENPDDHKSDGDALGQQTVVVSRRAPEGKPVKTVGKPARARGRR